MIPFNLPLYKCDIYVLKKTGKFLRLEKAPIVQILTK